MGIVRGKTVVSDTDPERRKRPSKGCLLALFVVLFLAIFVGANFQRIRGWWQTGTQEVSEIFKLRTRLQEEFDVRQVTIGLNSLSESGSKLLTVKLKNPPFMDSPEEELQSRAKQIAELVYAEYGSAREYDEVKVVITKARGSFITVSNKRDFAFSPEDLQPAAEEETDASL